jgi:GNAT superfamily N-acetyltransferase
MNHISIRKAARRDLPVVLSLVESLLRELGEEGDELGELQAASVVEAWDAQGERTVAFLAETASGEAVGVVTVVETFAIYANRCYGIINEMYVAPDYRSGGVGARLVSEVITLGRARGWSRIDVTAPEMVTNAPILRSTGVCLYRAKAEVSVIVGEVLTQNNGISPGGNNTRPNTLSSRKCTATYSWRAHL